MEAISTHFAVNDIVEKENAAKQLAADSIREAHEQAARELNLMRDQ